MRDTVRSALRMGWMVAIGPVGLMVFALPAHAAPGAGLDACGNVYIEAQAECEVIPPGAQCEAQCDPISVDAVCAVDLSADCRAECDELPSVSCTGECRADCMADCTVDPGRFDCKTSCGARCGATCEAECSAAADERECIASCEGSCSATCDSACDIRAPTADCAARCEASCNGSCEVEPNLDCQIDCQARGRAACEARVEGGCIVDCETQEGALFCDGYYVDHGNNLEQCLNALRDELAARVTVEASGTSMCENGTCTASGRAKVSSGCSVATVGSRPLAGYAGFVAAAALLVLVRRRTRARRS